jgi:hypothetical protein
LIALSFLASLPGHLLLSYCAEPAVALVEPLDGQPQILGAEVGPHSIGEYQFGICLLPEQKVGGPPFATGANDLSTSGGVHTISPGLTVGRGRWDSILRMPE